MCYAPAKKSVRLAKTAISLIQEGKLPEAERVIAATHILSGRVINVALEDGKRVGDWVNEAESALLQAKRLVSSR